MDAFPFEEIDRRLEALDDQLERIGFPVSIRLIFQHFHTAGERAGGRSLLRISQSQLAAAIGVSRSWIQAATAAIEAAGFVERRRNPAAKDRRYVYCVDWSAVFAAEAESVSLAELFDSLPPAETLTGDRVSIDEFESLSRVGNAHQSASSDRSGGQCPHYEGERLLGQVEGQPVGQPVGQPEGRLTCPRHTSTRHSSGFERSGIGSSGETQSDPMDSEAINDQTVDEIERFLSEPMPWRANSDAVMRSLDVRVYLRLFDEAVLMRSPGFGDASHGTIRAFVAYCFRVSTDPRIRNAAAVIGAARRRGDFGTTDRSAIEWANAELVAQAASRSAHKDPSRARKESSQRSPPREDRRSRRGPQALNESDWMEIQANVDELIHLQT